MGVKVDPSETTSSCSTASASSRETRVYYLLNKPAGYICTNSDERGRPRAVDLIQNETRASTPSGGSTRTARG